MKEARSVAAAALPAYCEVLAVVAPAVRVQMRLPSSGWKRRILVAGCGGLCGTLAIEHADDALARGYATATTDMGHDAAAGSAWLKDAGLLEDFGHRSTHVTALLAKAVVKAYYGDVQRAAYFRGCSTGGRQGLTEALRYPEDFDGIVAGAPATYLTVPIDHWYRQSNRPVGDTDVLDYAAFALLHAAALAACDARDGLKDGLISNPLGCHFDPGQLQCKAGSDKARCLTSAQVAVARKFYAGPRSRGAALTTLGMAPGSELGVASNMVSIKGAPPRVDSVLAISAQFALGPTATWRDFNFDTDLSKPSITEVRPDLGPDGRRLAQFDRRHGKLLMYSGWIDPLVSPTIAIDFYRANAAALGDSTSSFLRLFMMPGMGHCGGGGGPDAVDWLTSLETWVEGGTAPDAIVSYQLRNPPAEHRESTFPIAADRIERARPLYPFPAYAQYRGHGDPADPTSFEPHTGPLAP